MEGVLLILGEEEFLAREETAAVLRNRADLEWTRVAGEGVTVAAILDELRTPTLLGAPRGVLVEGAEPLLEGGALEAIARYAAKPAPGTLLVLRARKLDARFSASKALLKAAESRTFAPLKGAEVASYVVRRARDLGIEARREAVDALRARIGDDPGLLDAALRRLATQILPRRRLEAQDVLDSTDEQRSPLLFDATNALESADLPLSLRSVRACFEEGIRLPDDTVTDEQAVALILLGRLHNAWGKLLRYHLRRAEGEEERAAALAAGVPPPAAGYFAERARHHRLDRLLSRHEAFLECDAALKGGEAGGARGALETLLLRLLA